MDPQTPQSAMSDVTWRMSSLETKIKLNEQSLFNVQERIQLLSKNFLDLKQELRNRVDNMSDEIRDIEKKLDSMNTRLVNAPKSEDVEQIKKFHESINVFKPEMSADEAKNILDDVLKQLEK